MEDEQEETATNKPAPSPFRAGTDAAGSVEIQAAMMQIERLLRLVSFPITVESCLQPEPRVPENWDVSAPAMLFSASSCLLSLRLLAETAPRREQDAIVLLRRLYEHAVDFAWIAIDPAVNAKKWVAEDYAFRIKIDNEFVKLGQPGLTAQTRSEFEQFVIANGTMPDMASRADAADRHWSKLIAGHGVFPAKPVQRGSKLASAQNGNWSLRTQYTIVYRLASANAHPTPMSISDYVDAHGATGRFTVGVNLANHENRYAYTLAPLIYATMLFVAENTLGYPKRSSVEGVFSAIAAILGSTT